MKRKVIYIDISSKLLDGFSFKNVYKFRFKIIVHVFVKVRNYMYSKYIN